MDLETAKKEICTWVKEHSPEPKPNEVSIYDYDSHGIRVSEVGMSWEPNGKDKLPMHGLAWMQSDPDSCSVCLVVERLILLHLDDLPTVQDDDEDIFYFGEERWRLAYLLWGNDVANEIDYGWTKEKS